MEKTLPHQLGHVLVIGGGRMGEAVTAALVSIPGASAADIEVANPGLARRDHLAEAYGVGTVPDAAHATPADTVILAVKPQILDEVVLQAVADGAFARASLVISIAAGRTTAQVEALIPAGIAVVRVMPNMPLMCGRGAAAVSGGASASPEQVELALELFRMAGGAVEVPEAMQGVATAISGSGPAYFALLVDELAKAGESAGLTYAQAYRLALDTMAGTADLLDTSGMGATELIDAVSSPGGTTEAAVVCMREKGIGEAVDAGVDAAIHRSEELSAR